MRISDCSSDVCSSELVTLPALLVCKADALRDFVGRLTRGFVGVQWDRDIIGRNQRHEVPAIPRGRSVDHAVVVVLGKAGTNGADISADVLALLRAVSRQLDDLPCVLETGQRRRFFVRVEVKNRLNRRSEEHTSELQSLMRISYDVFCLKKKKKTT